MGRRPRKHEKQGLQSHGEFILQSGIMFTVGGVGRHYRSIYRRTLGRYIGRVAVEYQSSIDRVSVECRSTIGRYFGRYVCRPIRFLSLVDTRPIPYRYFTDSLPIPYQYSVDISPILGPSIG